MSTLENNIWKELTQDFNSDLHNVILQQHHAAQFIALVGRHMIPQQADDSNTNMGRSFSPIVAIGSLTRVIARSYN